jgi:low affinity Fe/Cu permease
MSINKFAEFIAKQTTVWAGTSQAFVAAIIIVLVWLCAGPFFEWSDSHSLFINTLTTILTFLMVFLIQRTQNKEQIALHLKLNELLVSHEGASNRLLHIENLTEAEIEKLVKRYHSLAEKALTDINKTAQHTVEEIDDD